MEIYITPSRMTHNEFVMCMVHPIMKLPYKITYLNGIVTFKSLFENNNIILEKKTVDKIDTDMVEVCYPNLDSVAVNTIRYLIRSRMASIKFRGITNNVNN